MRCTALSPSGLYYIEPLYLFHHSALFANICNQPKALTLCRVGRLVVWKAQIWVEAEFTDALSSKTKAVQLLS